MSEDYVESATLQNGMTTRMAGATTTGGPEGHFGQAGQDAAATVGQSVVSIVADLDGTNRTDVSNTLEFASRASNHVAQSNSGEWFEAYISSIANLGWYKQSVGRREIDLSQTTTGCPMVDLVNDLVQGDDAFDDAQKKVIGRTLDSLMAQSNRRALFNSFTSTNKENSFSVTAATVKNGALAMRMVGFYFVAEQEVTDCLFFTIKQETIKIYKDVTDFAANQGTIDANRQKITDKLHGATGNYIDDTPLD